MIRFIYNLLWPIGLLFFLPRYLVKMFRRGGYRKKFGQRFGIYDVDLRDRFANQMPIWLHAVSVGEVAIALKLIRLLRELRPEQSFALTRCLILRVSLTRRTMRKGLTFLHERSRSRWSPISHRS